ncbi:porin [Undibacterium terreum]|uniref:Porin n=1 Tax=Undibacterium terreum TaxID=1224302 RepID=A0A916UYL2_9BURK|nr:porin [Undibacterium terreum]GGC94310.1 porin [Undibacterium terreum]
MKKFAHSFVLLASVLGSSAYAQSNVVIYGDVDGGIRTQTNANAAGGTKVFMGSNGFYNSNKLDFADREDLGGGLEAHFLLESGFNLATGAYDNTTGTPFQRQSYMGLKGSFGSIDFGRQYTISHDFILEYDPFGFRYTPLIPLTQASSGTRFSNDAKYVGKFGPIKLELENSFGETAGSFNNGSARGIGLQYYIGDLTIGASYNRRSILVGTTSYFNENYYLVGAAYNIGSLKISGGYMSDTLNNKAPAPDQVTHNTFGGVSWNITELMNLTGGYYQTRVSTDKARRKGLAIIGLDYSLSKRTKLYIEFDNTQYRNAVVSTLNAFGVSDQNAFTFGVNSRF